MNKKNILIIIMALIGMAALETRAQETGDPLPLEGSAKTALIDSITAGYTEWDTVSMSGKLSSPMLPVTATVKVYMEREQLTIISVAAPFVGEAMRIEIDNDRILAVNKMKNTYATMESALVESLCPGGLTALQNMFLGRVNILGRGQLTPRLADAVDIYSAENNAWVLLPEQDYATAPYVYLYTVSKVTLLLNKFMVLTEGHKSDVQCFYTWTPADMSIRMMTILDDEVLEATLKLNNPDSAPKKMERFEVTPKYKKVSPGKVLNF